MDCSDDSVNFLPAKSSFAFQLGLPNKKARNRSPGLSFRVIKTIPKKLLSIESGGSITRIWLFECFHTQQIPIFLVFYSKDTIHPFGLDDFI